MGEVYTVGYRLIIDAYRLVDASSINMSFHWPQQKVR